VTVNLLTRAEAAKLLRITPEQLAEHVRDGELPYINVGRGVKRPRMRFTELDLAEFIERRKRRCATCPSISRDDRRTTDTTSSSKVIGFMALRDARRAAKQKPSNGSNANRQKGE
jgi:excisionase family DNA binding protein